MGVMVCDALVACDDRRLQVYLFKAALSAFSVAS